MKAYLAVATIALLVTASKAGQIVTAYNLISQPEIHSPLAYSTLGSELSVPLVPGIVPAHTQPQSQAHPAVVQNAIAESQLPPELLNNFYKNPAIAAGLAKSSWFGDKEFPVHHREAEKISREQIYKIVSRLQHRRR